MNALRSTLFAVWVAFWSILTAPLVVIGAITLRGIWAYRLGKLWRLGMQFGIENLLDKLYYLPLGGAYLGQGRTMSINPVASDGMFGWGTAVPGMGRSLYAGINVKF